MNYEHNFEMMVGILRNQKIDILGRFQNLVDSTTEKLMVSLALTILENLKSVNMESGYIAKIRAKQKSFPSNSLTSVLANLLH